MSNEQSAEMFNYEGFRIIVTTSDRGGDNCGIQYVFGKGTVYSFSQFDLAVKDFDRLSSEVEHGGSRPQSVKELRKQRVAYEASSLLIEFNVSGKPNTPRSWNKGGVCGCNFEYMVPLSKWQVVEQSGYEERIFNERMKSQDWTTKARKGMPSRVISENLSLAEAMTVATFYKASQPDVSRIEYPTHFFKGDQKSHFGQSHFSGKENQQLCDYEVYHGGDNLHPDCYKY